MIGEVMGDLEVARGALCGRGVGDRHCRSVGKMRYGANLFGCCIRP